MTTQELIRAAILGLLVGAVLFVFGILIARTAKAEGDDSRWVYRTVRQQYVAYDHWTGHYVHRYRYVRQRIRNHAYYLPEREPTRVYGYARRDDDRDDRGGDCKPVRRMVGQQALSVDGAKKEANEAWAAAVRFHHGEKYLDLANARRITYSCSRSSIKEAGTSVTTLGQSFTRCEIEATPCRPQRDREER
jgi:hypothetical protein